MNERARLLDGDFTITAEIGKGIFVAVKVRRQDLPFSTVLKEDPPVFDDNDNEDIAAIKYVIF